MLSGQFDTLRWATHDQRQVSSAPWTARMRHCGLKVLAEFVAASGVFTVFLESLNDVPQLLLRSECAVTCRNQGIALHHGQLYPRRYATADPGRRQG